MHTHIFSVCLNVCELTSGSVASPKTETYEIIGEVCPDAVLLLSRAKALTFTVGNIWNVALMPIIAQPNVPLKHVTNHRNSPTTLSRVSELCCSCRFVMLLFVVIYCFYCDVFRTRALLWSTVSWWNGHSLSMPSPQRQYQWYDSVTKNWNLYMW